MTTLKAQDPVYGGYVLTRHEEAGIIFIRGAIPGELVEVSIEEKKRDYSVARVEAVLEPSEHRVEPGCQHFGDCGGCHMQYIAYEQQLEMKEAVLRDCLRRIGGLEAELAPNISGDEFRYRHRAQFKVSKTGEIGFFREGTIDVVPIAQCPLMVDSVNDALYQLRTTELEGIREIHLTAGNDGTVALIKGVGFSAQLADRVMSLGLSGVAFDDGAYRGSGPAYVTLDLNGFTYTVSPWSFFQSNWAVNRKCVDLITREVGSLEGKRLLDLYCGGGNFALHLAVSADETYCVEENAHGIDDAKRNRSANRITGVKFIKGMAETARLDGAFDVVLLDPPRPGLSKEVMRRLLELGPQRIVYVSCNPSTFARDLKIMIEHYHINSIRMMDFFPNTYHLESVAFLTKK